MDGMISSSVQIGNSDVVNEYAYVTNERLMDTVSNIKHMNGVDKVRWSEEVYRVPIASENILSSFNWSNGNNSHDNKPTSHNRNYNNSNSHSPRSKNKSKKYFY
jgi:hypothetical protein